MAPSIDQYAPVFLPGEPRLWQRDHSTGSQIVRHDRSDPVCIDPTLFYACGSPAPARVAREGGAAAWLAGTPAALSVQGHGLPLPQVLWPFQSLFFWSSCSWRSEGLFGQSFSLAPPVQTLRGFPFLGSSPDSFNILRIWSDVSFDNGNVFTLFSFY